MANNSEHTDYNSLVTQYQDGDQKALRLLIREFHPKLKQVVYATTRDYASVDDLVQECWHSIIPKLDSVTLKISFEAWALTIARRRAIDWIRDQQVARRRSDKLKKEAETEALKDESDDKEEKLDEIRLGIQQLPMSQRIVLTMFYLENLSLSEISSVLDVSKGTVKSRLFYARETLKSIINNKEQ
jgi:RNA polymerase sigma-70 factor (ECF subfamily)